jgi:arylsulfatase
MPEEVGPNIRGRSFVIGASLREVQPGCEGVIFAQGSRFGGHTLYVRDRKLVYEYNFLGIEQYRFEAPFELSGRVTCSVSFTKKSENPKFVPNGTLDLRIQKKVVASGPMRTQPGKFSIAGEGLTIGREGGDPVNPQNEPPFAFRGGIIEFVTFDMSGKPVIDLQREFAAYLARD